MSEIFSGLSAAADKESVEQFNNSASRDLASRIRALGGSSGRDFIRGYRKIEMEIFEGFIRIFRIIRIILLVSLGFSVLAALVALAIDGFVGAASLVSLIVTVVYLAMLAEVARLVSAYFLLRHQTTVYEMSSAEKGRQEVQKLGKELMENVRKRAHDIRAGNNAVIIIDSDNNSVTQNVSGAPELVEAFSMLLAYFRETQNKEGEALANEMVRETAKETPDKGRLMEIWTQIVAIAPGVTAIAGVVKAVTALFA